MVIIILGSGTITSSEKRNPAGFLINKKDRYALLDCGPGIIKQLLQIEKDITQISEIFISHFHLDHCADLLPLLMRNYLFDNNANKNITIFGPEGLIKWFNLSASTQGSWLHESPPKLVELKNNNIQWNGYNVTYCKTKHTENSLAFAFQNSDHKFFYSGDTDINNEIISLAKDADLAFIECSNRDENPVEGHMTPGKVSKFLQMAKPGKTILTHIYPQNDTADLLKRIPNSNQYNIEIGRDFLKFSL